MGVFAHPDDESFGPGGTLARYSAEGVAVHVIIATDGIAGSVEGSIHLQTHESLAQVRSKELTNAAVALGVTSIWSLPYRDSGMRGSPDNDHPQALMRQPLEHTVNEVLFYLERLRPQVVITHDPWGGYGHPDHIRCCAATTAAFYLAQSPQKLYYTAYDKRYTRVMARLMPLWGLNPRALGRNKDINLIEISSWETPIHAKLNIERYQPAKLAASKAHASQYSGGPTWAQKLPGFLRRRLLMFESFTRAFPAPGAVVEGDLFQGVA